MTSFYFEFEYGLLLASSIFLVATSLHKGTPTFLREFVRWLPWLRNFWLLHLALTWAIVFSGETSARNLFFLIPQVAMAIIIFSAFVVFSLKNESSEFFYLYSKTAVITLTIALSIFQAIIFFQI